MDLNIPLFLKRIENTQNFFMQEYPMDLLNLNTGYSSIALFCKGLNNLTTLAYATIQL